jgi:lauroyl/myristoyl acyltransferase
LEVAWENWAWRVDDFVRIEGVQHLSDALSTRQGAILLSGHYYGLDRLVDPILAQKGYAMSRWAHPLESESIEERWGNGNFAKWEVIDFRGDHWHHTQMLLTARRHLKEKRIVHISVRGQPDGAPECLVRNHYRSFFLEPKGLLLIEMLNAPVVPCFTIPDDRGNVVVKIYPPVQPLKHLVMASFGSLYTKHLNDYPEFTRIWRRVMGGDPWW